jgi:arabinogalactan oligomer/maltooligosaccharide transport system permease protein
VSSRLLFATGAIVAALACALPAAAQDTPPASAGEDARPELVLWHAYRAREQEVLEKAISELNASEKRFRVNVLPVPYDAYLDRITAAIPRGRGPDVFISAHDTIGDWAEAGTVSVVDDVLDPELVARLHDGLVPAVLYKGHAYGVPLSFKSLALWRRTDVVASAPRTLDELVSSAQAVTGDGRYGLVYENRDLYAHAPFLFGFGGALFDDAGRPVLDSQANVDSVKWAMATGKKVVPSEVNGALMLALFNDGKAAMMITGPWSRGDVAPGVPFAVSPLPARIVDGREVPTRPLLTVEAAMISGKSEKRALAVELVRILAGEDFSRRRLLDAAQPVADKPSWSALTDAHPDAQLLRGFLAQLDDAVPTPNTPAMKSVWGPFNLALGASLGQGLDPAVTLAEAQSKVKDLVAVIDEGVKEADSTELTLLVVVLGVVLGVFIAWRVSRYGLRKLTRDIFTQRSAYLYVLPAAIGMGVLVMLPFVLGIGMGFFEHTWGKYTFVGLENFKSILGGGDTKFFTTLAMTMLWTASNVTLHVVVGVFLALVLSQAKLRFRAMYRVLFIIPWAVPSYITALIWKGMFHPELGAINRALGIEGFSWMNATWSAFMANLITNVWLGFPFMMVIALGGLTAIPKDLYEAAALDGAGPLQRFRAITLPLLMPTLMPAIVLGTVWTFNMFNVIYLVSGGAPNNSTDILITEAFRWAFERGQGGAFGHAAAYSTLVFILLVAYTTAANRVARRVTEGT